MKRRFSLFASNRTIIIEKIKEAFSSVLPITLIILLLAFTITPLDNGTFLAFIAGAFLLVVGMGLFARKDVRNGKAGKLPNDKLIQSQNASGGDMNGYVNSGFSSGNDEEEIPFD